LSRRILEQLREEWRALDDRITDLDTEFVVVARQEETMKRLVEIPGIGALTATALVAAIGKGDAFDSGRDLAAWLGLVPRQATTGGRDLAAWLGLVPRQATTGGKPRLLGISKRGNAYVRRLFIHGARAALRYHEGRRTRLGAWLRGVLERRHRNVAVVALANKLVRIAWAVLRGGVHYTEFVAAK
jgi:transposase